MCGKFWPRPKDDDDEDYKHQHVHNRAFFGKHSGDTNFNLFQWNKPIFGFCVIGHRLLDRQLTRSAKPCASKEYMKVGRYS